MRIRSQPIRSVQTPARPLTSSDGRAMAAKCRASIRGLWVPFIRIQPLAVRPAKDPAVERPEAIRNVVR
jgi:hypothetical protein